MTVRYKPDGVDVLAGLSLSVAAGERVALVGLNGSGKTTLLMTAVGLIPHQGEIVVAGTLVLPTTLTKVREQVGFLFNVPEDQLLFPKVIEDVAFGLLRQGMSVSAATARANQTLALLGVAHLSESPLHHLSHGEKQRVALAGAIVVDPPLLLLDEPSANLDPPGKRVLSSLLADLDAAVLIATHDLDFAASLCTRFVLLEEGRASLDRADRSAVLQRWEMVMARTPTN